MGLFRKRAATDDDGDGGDEEARRLVLAFDALGPEARRRTTEKLRFLHTLLKDRYGGVGGFLTQSKDERQSFQRGLDEVVRSAHARGAGFEPYAISATMLASYLKALAEERTDAATAQLAARVVDVLNAAPPQGSSSPQGQP